MTIKIPDESLDVFKRVDTTLFYPPFLEKYSNALNRCHNRGQTYVVTSGTRTWIEQSKLFRLGRDASGKVIDKKAVRTNADAGESWHNYGIAADAAPHVGEWLGKLNPDFSDARYKIYIEEMEAEGLECGARWKAIHDTPHVQLPISTKGLTRTLLAQAYARGGLPGVWALLDRFSW